MRNPLFITLFFLMPFTVEASAWLQPVGQAQISLKYQQAREIRIREFGSIIGDARAEGLRFSERIDLKTQEIYIEYGWLRHYTLTGKIFHGRIEGLDIDISHYSHEIGLRRKNKYVRFGMPLPFFSHWVLKNMTDINIKRQKRATTEFNLFVRSYDGFHSEGAIVALHFADQIYTPEWKFTQMFSSQYANDGEREYNELRGSIEFGWHNGITFGYELRDYYPATIAEAHREHLYYIEDQLPFYPKAQIRLTHGNSNFRFNRGGRDVTIIELRFPIKF